MARKTEKDRCDGTEAARNRRRNRRNKKRMTDTMLDKPLNYGGQGRWGAV